MQTPDNTVHFSVAVIGAGPAGLAAANVLRTFTSDFVVVDSGKPAADRDRYAASDIANGVGGAGLFSDGKYSFYPASTELWNLADRAALHEAYSWTSDILGGYGLSCPPFPRASSTAQDDPKDSWFLKRYPSAYIPLNDRLHMIQLLQEHASAITNASESKPEFLLESTVESWSYDEIDQLFTFMIRTNDASGRKVITLTARYAVFAGGRFFPLLMAKQDKCPKRFLRVEVGLRIEDSSTNPFWQELEGLDPKYKFVTDKRREKPVEWRTFCCCREGEVVRTDSCGISTWSGRADCPQTQTSNIGFNTRYLHSDGNKHLAGLLQSQSATPSFSVLLQSLLQAQLPEIEELYGTELAASIREGVILLCQEFPSLAGSKTARVIGPTIEGVGFYPCTDMDLKLSNGWRGWVVGDAQGTFRGIVAAMVSGAYAALKLKQEYIATTNEEVSPSRRHT